VIQYAGKADKYACLMILCVTNSQAWWCTS